MSNEENSQKAGSSPAKRTNSPSESRNSGASDTDLTQRTPESGEENMRSAEKFSGNFGGEKAGDIESKEIVVFLDRDPLPPASLGFLKRQNQIPFRLAASPLAPAPE